VWSIDTPHLSLAAVEGGEKLISLDLSLSPSLPRDLQITARETRVWFVFASPRIERRIAYLIF
jgi:hypothetical protein